MTADPHLPTPDTSGASDVSAMGSLLAGLRPFPHVVELVRVLAADPRSAPRDIATVVEGDVGVAADVLRVANAPASGLTQRCVSVRHAVSLLGTRRVAEVVAGAAALAIVEQNSALHPSVGVHAIAVGGAARLLAPIIGMSPDEAFTLGLLHDIGAMLVLQSGDPFYEGLIEHSPSGEEPSVDDERALMGFDHGALGGEVLRQWRMPAPLPEVVTLHHRWEAALEAGGAITAQVAIVRAAEKLVDMVSALSEPSLDQLSPLFEEPAFAHIGITRQEIHTLWPALRQACDKAFVVASRDGQQPDAGVANDHDVVRAPDAQVIVPMPAPSAQATPAIVWWIALAAFVATAVVGVLVKL